MRLQHYYLSYFVFHFCWSSGLFLFCFVSISAFVCLLCFSCFLLLSNTVNKVSQCWKVDATNYKKWAPELLFNVLLPQLAFLRYTGNFRRVKNETRKRWLEINQKRIVHWIRCNCLRYLKRAPYYFDCWSFLISSCKQFRI